MARFRRSSAFTELLEIAAHLPWKVSLGLAAISLLILHVVAAALDTALIAQTTADLGGVVIHRMIQTAAFFCQFVVPPAFLLGAIVSYGKKSRSIKLFDETRTSLRPAVASLTWRQFERLIAEGFRRRGFQVTEKGGAAPDGGIDLVLARGTEQFLVQCKQWRARQVPVTTVRELYGVMAAQHAAGGYVVSSGRFTKDAAEFAAGRNIELIDGAALEHWLLRPKRLEGETAALLMPTFRAPAAPTCPRCKEPMVARVAKRGANVGNEFWGCRRYPKCIATLPRI